MSKNKQICRQCKKPIGSCPAGTKWPDGDFCGYRRPLSTDEQIKVLREQVRNLASVANSVSLSADRKVNHEGPGFWQTAEWCEWVRDMEEGAREALALTAPDTEGV